MSFPPVNVFVFFRVYNPCVLLHYSFPSETTYLTTRSLTLTHTNEHTQATVDFECQDSGFLAKILLPGGTSEVPVGKAVAIMVESKEAAEAFKAMPLDAVLASLGGGKGAAAAPTPAPKAAAAPAASPAPAAAVAAPVAAATAPAAAPAGGRVIASPYAKKVRACIPLGDG